MLATSNFVAGRLAHLQSIRPIVLARQHIHGTLLHVDAGHAAATVPAACVGLVVSECPVMDGPSGVRAL
jgi:hypothetical protein